MTSLYTGEESYHFLYHFVSTISSPWLKELFTIDVISHDLVLYRFRSTDDQNMTGTRDEVVRSSCSVPLVTRSLSIPRFLKEGVKGRCGSLTEGSVGYGTGPSHVQPPRGQPLTTRGLPSYGQIT